MPITAILASPISAGSSSGNTDFDSNFLAVGRKRSYRRIARILIGVAMMMAMVIASAIVTSYRLSQAADEDLDRLFDHGIDRFGLDQAIEYLDGLIQRFSELAETPNQWQAVEHIRVNHAGAWRGSGAFDAGRFSA